MLKIWLSFAPDKIIIPKIVTQIRTVFPKSGCINSNKIYGMHGRNVDTTPILNSLILVFFILRCCAIKIKSIYLAISIGCKEKEKTCIHLVAPPDFLPNIGTKTKIRRTIPII